MPTLSVIATLRTCYNSKFGVPRQSGLVPAAWGIIEFNPPWRRAEALRGIDDFSHLWLVTLFHLVPKDTSSLTVRPPKLGGNERRGVFATRSPFRPNRLTLSAVKLDHVEWEGANGPRLHVSGVDLVDGTPVLDIKPYIRYADSIPEAHCGFADTPPPSLPVKWLCETDAPAGIQQLIEQTLAQQPEPAYQDDPERTYATEIAGWHLTWKTSALAATVLSCTPTQSSTSSFFP
jgi:tRNA-Thr(GGU) m(6)t(6)A37 methyltransferase TsaA